MHRNYNNNKKNILYANEFMYITAHLLKFSNYLFRKCVLIVGFANFN